MTNLLSQRRLPLLFLLGCVLCALACALLLLQVKMFAIEKDRAMAVGTRLPEVTSRVNLLSAMLESEKAYGADVLSSKEEQAAVYILPSQPDTARTVRVLQEIVRGFTTPDQLGIDKLTFGQPTVQNGRKELAGTLVMHGDFSWVTRVIALMEMSGRLSVSDVLPSAVTNDFLGRMEAANPASLGVASKFLYMDLLAYSEHADDAETQVFADVPIDTAADARTLLLQSGLADVRRALSPVAAHLREQAVWPLPLMRVKSVTGKGNVWTVEFVLMSR